MHQTVTHGMPAGAPLQPVYQPLFQPAAFTGAVSVLRPKVVEKFRRGKAIAIGTTLIVAAVLGAIFNTVEIIISRDRGLQIGEIGHGFWIGAIVVVAGAFGIAAGMRRTRGMIQAFNVLCIVAASLTSVQFIISVIGSVAYGSRLGCSHQLDESDHRYYWSKCYRDGLAMEALLAILAVVEAIVAICGSVMCCRTACCCASCCDSTPVAQNVLINDIPMTVIYQPQNRSITVSCHAVPVQGAPYQMPIQQQAMDATSPPAYSQHQPFAASSNQTNYASAVAMPGRSFDQQEVVDENRGMQEKRELM